MSCLLNDQTVKRGAGVRLQVKFMLKSVSAVSIATSKALYKAHGSKWLDRRQLHLQQRYAEACKLLTGCSPRGNDVSLLAEEVRSKVAACWAIFRRFIVGFINSVLGPAEERANLLNPRWPKANRN
jgi:hypothetical protein